MGCIWVLFFGFRFGRFSKGMVPWESKRKGPKSSKSYILSHTSLATISCIHLVQLLSPSPKSTGLEESHVYHDALNMMIVPAKVPADIKKLTFSELSSGRGHNGLVICWVNEVRSIPASKIPCPQFVIVLNLSLSSICHCLQPLSTNYHNFPTTSPQVYNVGFFHMTLGIPHASLLLRQYSKPPHIRSAKPSQT